MELPEATAVALRMAAELVRARDERQAAAATARAAGLLVGADAVRVWLLDRTRGYRFVGAWPESGDPPAEPPREVARVVAFGEAIATRGEGTFRSRLILPLVAGLRPLGAIELLERERAGGPFRKSDAGALAGLIQAADEAILAVRAHAGRERANLEAITRLTRLFDVGRSIAATLDRDELQRIVINRVVHAMEVESAYLWLLDAAGERLAVRWAAGPASEAVAGWEVGPEEGAAGRVLATQENLLADEADELEELGFRPDAEAGLAVTSVAAVPIRAPDGRFLGVIEAVNRDHPGTLLTQGDLAMLREIADSAAIALVHVNRIDAERKAGDLGLLLEVAQEMGSHLDVQKVTFTLVHRMATVVRYRRAAVGLLRGTRLELTAVSGQTFVDDTLPEMKTLADALNWAAGLDDGIYVVQEDDGSIDTERAQTAQKFKTFFEKTGSRSFLAVPLRDEEGRIGALTLEADVPYAFSERDLEAASLLGVQATVAIRNALLYEQMPMARVFRPLARSKAGWVRKPWESPVARVGALGLIALVLALVPAPLRVSGRARVLAESRLPVTAEVEGRVAQVLVREGDAVEAGDVLAILDGQDYLAGREDAEARYRVALRERNRHVARGSAADAAVELARLDGLRAELDLWESRVARTQLRTPISGIVATPRVDELVGASVGRGQLFCEVVDDRPRQVEVAVPEADAGLLEARMPVKVKLHAYPTRSFRGTLSRIGVSATVEDDRRVFLVRVQLDDPHALLRPGMTGQAKIDTGSRSAARVLLRRPARWLWGIAWGYLP